MVTDNNSPQFSPLRLPLRVSLPRSAPSTPTIHPPTPADRSPASGGGRALMRPFTYFILGSRGGLLSPAVRPAWANAPPPHQRPTLDSTQLAQREFYRGLLRMPGKRALAASSGQTPQGPSWGRGVLASPSEAEMQTLGFVSEADAMFNNQEQFFFCYPPNLSIDTPPKVGQEKTWSFVFDRHTKEFSGSSSCSHEEDFGG